MSALGSHAGRALQSRDESKEMFRRELAANDRKRASLGQKLNIRRTNTVVVATNRLARFATSGPAAQGMPTACLAKAHRTNQDLWTEFWQCLARASTTGEVRFHKVKAQTQPERFMAKELMMYRPLRGELDEDMVLALYSEEYNGKAKVTLLL